MITKLVSDITTDPGHPTDEVKAPGLAAADGVGIPSIGVVPGVPEWRRTSTLAALEELVEVAEALPAAVARHAGLSTSELHSLRHLIRGSLGPVELAKLLGVTTAASSGIVDRLTSHGHAERRSHPTDKRRTEVIITDSGRAEVLALLRPMFEALAALDATLDEQDRVVVERYLRGAIAAMRRLMA